VGALALTAILAGIPAYYAIFTVFAPQDDEGYLLITLKSYLDVGGLYDHVFTQYGPFYYEALGSVYRVLGKPVTLDSGRDLTLVMWVVATFLCGLAIARLTRSTLLGIGGTLIVSRVLITYPGEPMHPGHLLVLLLSALIAIAVLLFESRPMVAMTAMGLVAGAALLTKINVGVFACLAVVFAAAFAFATGPIARWLRPLVVVLAVGVPFALMEKKLGKGWGDGFALPFAVHVGLALLALGLASMAVTATFIRRPGALWTIAAFFAGATGLIVASAAGVLLDGTSVRGLVDGVVVHPLNHPNVLFGVVVIRDWVFVFDFLMVAAAGLVALSGRELRVASRPVVAGGRIVAGAAIWYILATTSVAGGPQALWLPLSLAWIAALPSSRDGVSAGATFLRLFVPALAVFESMHAYPVSGSQTGWSAFLFAIVGAVCIADGVADFGVWLQGHAPEWRHFYRNATGALIGALVMGAIFLAFLLPLQTYSRGYYHGVPLGLPGTARIRLPVGTRDAYTGVAAEVKSKCSTFVSLPGLNSFYLLTGESPPTTMNAEDEWMFLLDDAQQQRIVDAVRNKPGLCAIRHDGILAFWEQGRPLPQRPLVRFIETRFKPVYSLAGFQVLTEKERRR
jgi:hypothetical protein